MTYERACVLVDGAWTVNTCARCLPDGWKDSDGHEVEVRTSHVGAVEWFGETKEA